MRGKVFYLSMAFFMFVLTWIPVSAGGAGGIEVHSVQACLDGTMITGRASVPEVIGRDFRGAIFSGNVSSGVPEYWSRVRTYGAVGEEWRYIIQYPDYTYLYGENVTVSVLAQDESGYGGGRFEVVQYCRLADILEAWEIPGTVVNPVDPIRIQFAAGATSAVIHDGLIMGEVKNYILGAMGGQTMTVNLSSSDNEAFLRITGVDGTVLLDSAYVQNSWTGILPSTQDYYIQVIADASNETYSLEIIIPPAPESPDYTQYQQSASNRAAFTNYLQQVLTWHDYESLPAMMSDPFNVGVWQSEGSTWSVAEMVSRLEDDLLPATGTIEFPDIGADAVTPGVNLWRLFPDADTFLYSRGWGLDGNTEVIIVIKQDPVTVFTWDALLIAPGGFAPTNVAGGVQPCDFEWFFTPAPAECPPGAPVFYDTVIQNFETGLMIWFEGSGSIFVIPDGAGWYAYSDPWVEGMPLSNLSETPPDGLEIPVRGFGLVWQEYSNREWLGWATGPEFAYQMERQCDDRLHGANCYYQLPGGVIQLRPQSLWSYWN